MSLNSIDFLKQLPTTEATILLTCRHCKMTGIASHAFIDAPNIVSLDLAYNNIKSTELFPEIFRGPEQDEKYAPIKLQTLDLSHNSISYLEKILFEHTPELKSLDLSFNPINQFDEPTENALASLHNLEV
jgi:Leucine-rich repeat (LRR) protein